MKDRPKLSIIIPTYNAREFTLNCLASIHKSPPEDSYEIILVDNHSNDGTYEAVQRLYREVQAFQNPANLGFSKACNLGASHAQGDYLLFLNSDAEPLEGALQTLIDWLQNHPQTGIVGPTLLGPNESLLQMSWAWDPLLLGELVQQFFAPYSLRRSRYKQHLAHFLQRRSRRVPSLCGACLMIRLKTFEQLQGFDENFELYFEESDLCRRALIAGWGVDFVAEAKVIHHLGQSTRGRWSRTSIIYQQSHLAYYRKHGFPGAVGLLKIYLLLKWLRLLWASRFDPANRDRSRAYCKAYFQMIQEKTRLNLQDTETI
jgi:hypothetical protein